MEFKILVQKNRLVGVNGYRHFEAFLASYLTHYPTFPHRSRIMFEILSAALPQHVNFVYPFPTSVRKMTPFPQIFPAPVIDVYLCTIGDSLGEWVTAILRECELRMPLGVLEDGEHTYTYESSKPYPPKATLLPTSPEKAMAEVIEEMSAKEVQEAYSAAQEELQEEGTTSYECPNCGHFYHSHVNEDSSVSLICLYC